MPLTAQMSLLGLYQYDPTILDGLTLPTGMDAGTVKDSLLMETASMEILYPDVNFMKAAITVWSAERQDVWNKLYATTQFDYNPIENYDRTEESVSSSSGTSEGSGSSSGSGRTTGSATSSGSNTATNSATAYNRDTFADVTKADSEGRNVSSNSSVQENASSQESSARSTSAGTFKSRIRGNIGVTTSQQMIQQERDISLFCMTEFIINDFITRFCVGVY